MSPMADWKALFPTYTVRVERRAYDYNYNQYFESERVAISVPSSNVYSGTYNVSYSDAVTSYEYFYGDPVLEDSLKAVINRRFIAVRARPDWAGYYYGNSSFNGTLNAGGDSMTVSLSEYYSTTTTMVGVPVITWQAESFSQWNWPDPTLHGLLPGVTSTGQLLSTFGVHDYQWEREIVLDWTAGGGGPFFARASDRRPDFRQGPRSSAGAGLRRASHVPARSKSIIRW